MAWILTALALILGLRLVGFPARHVWLLAGLAWVLVLALLLAAPAAPVMRGLGLDSRGWIILGGLAAVALGYAGMLGRLRGRAARRADGLPEDALATAPFAPLPASGAQADAPGSATGLASAGAPADDAMAQTRDGPEEPDDALTRYARHIVLREIGGAGQARLGNARVLIVGAGGLGSPAALYLAAAGIGGITLADDDRVSLSNLQRQILFRTADAGRPKVEAARDRLQALNPHVTITVLPRRIGSDDAALLAGHDLVLDGCDSFASRDAVNRCCVAAGVPLLAGSIAQWEGQLALYDPHRGGPCLTCLFPTAPAPGLALPCAEAGVVGPLPGVIGSMMALEAIKHLTGAGTGLRGQMILFDGLHGESRRIGTRARPDCPVCSGLEASSAGL